MIFAKRAAFAAAAFSGLMLVATANAADARLSDCHQMASQVAAAMSTAHPGQATDAAQQEAKTGQGYCALALYAQGVAHYAKALQILGQPQSKG